MKGIINRGVYLVVIMLIAAFPSFSQQEDYVVINAQVITMDENVEILTNQYLKVIDGKISDLGSMENYEEESDLTVIDAGDGFIVPGIAEMHAHIPSKNSGDEIIEETLFLYLSNGITTIRGMLGESYHLELRDEVLNGKILGPRIYTSGPSLNGNSVKSVEQAQKTVTAQKEAGYDFLKLHPGLTIEVFDAIVTTANEVGIPYSGHVSIDVGIRHALESKYASVDHVDGYLEGLVPESAGVNPEDNGFFGINFTELADESTIPELVELTKSNQVWVVPTQSLMERWVGPEDPGELAKDPEMIYMNPNTVNRWVQIKESYTSGSNYSNQLGESFIKIRLDIIKALHEGDVNLLLGSDAPQVFNVPGFSIRNECNSMVSAGLTPMDVLISGTVNPARFFEAEDSFGKIKVGLSADFVITESSPIEDINNYFNQKGVMVRGQWLSKESIDQKLSSIEDKYRR